MTPGKLVKLAVDAHNAMKALMSTGAVAGQVFSAEPSHEVVMATVTRMQVEIVKTITTLEDFYKCVVEYRSYLETENVVS